MIRIKRQKKQNLVMLKIKDICSIISQILVFQTFNIL